jgi:hypothetical protein
MGFIVFVYRFFVCVSCISTGSRALAPLLSKLRIALAAWARSFPVPVSVSLSVFLRAHSLGDAFRTFRSKPGASGSI